MKLRLHTPISNLINLEFKHKPRTRNPHIERKVQIIKLDPLRCRQPREQPLRHRVQIRRQRAHVDESLAEGIRCGFDVTCDQVVLDNEGLAGSEVARVVE
jgi:hypothetical protein